MDFEASADAWYGFLAVAIVSVALSGLALGVSAGPPPDAERAASAIDGAAASEHAASASYEHDADLVTIDRRTITMENDHGTSHARFSYGVVVPVNGHERLENLTHGSSFDEEYGTAPSDPDTHALETFVRDVEAAFDDNTGESLAATGDLRARQVVVDAEVDALEPLPERAEVEVTKTASLPIEGRVRENVREVTLSYDGVDGRTVHVEVTGEYAAGGEFEERARERFADGSGEIPIEISSSRLRQPAAEPVAFDVAFEEDGELTGETWRSDDLEIGDRRVWENEIEREPEFDDDHPALEFTDGGTVRVTLVIV